MLRSNEHLNRIKGANELKQYVENHYHNTKKMDKYQKMTLLRESINASLN